MQYRNTLVLLALVGCGETRALEPDADPALVADASSTADALEPGDPDAATPGLDAATPGLDAATPDLDAAGPEADASVESDAAIEVPGPDAGQSEPDAGGPTFEANVMFVTSTTYSGDLDGLEGADALCNERAAAAGLPGTYVAWLSISTTDAIERLGGADGWVRPDGKIVATTPDKLVAGFLYYPPRLDEYGNDVGINQMVRTGTVGEGAVVPSLATCADWDGVGGTTVGGYADAGSYVFSSFSGQTCAAQSRLYCLGVDLEVSLPPPQAEGRRAFVTAASWTPGNGIDSADELCKTEAQELGLPGDFKAALATEGATAASRFDTTGAPWVRSDGVAITTTAAGMFTGAMHDVALNVASDGTHHSGTNQWTGASAQGAAGTEATTCDDWTSTEGTGQQGNLGFTNTARTFGGFSVDCAGSGKLICLED